MMHATTADVVLFLSNMGTIIGAIALFWRSRAQNRTDTATIHKLEQEINKARVNRLVHLERYSDLTVRYIRDLRDWLLAQVHAGAIDMTKVDMASMPQPPPVPTINGDDR